MKRVFTILVAVLLTACQFAQSPQKMSYQAVIRDATNHLVTTQVGMQISILQGSESGTPVYVETQTPTPNINGLVTIEIGTGTTTDDFSAINWANGPYFIKTETDPLGGTTYNITGTNQLLSVPYALHAKTVTSYSEIDPVYTSSHAVNITTTDIANLDNLSGVNTGDQDGSETKVTAGTNVIITGNGTTISPYVVNATSGSTHAIGDTYKGGKIFWLDASGQHGLIAATSDQSAGIQWSNGSFTTTNAVRDGYYAGMYNTERIIANQGVGSYAAQLCSNYKGDEYGDWYLPSKYELNLLYTQKTIVGGFASSFYWSSTESTSNSSAWLQDFNDGLQHDVAFLKESTLYVRAIRAF
jgi:hypothetical protein